MPNQTENKQVLLLAKKALLLEQLDTINAALAVERAIAQRAEPAGDNAE